MLAKIRPFAPFALALYLFAGSIVTLRPPWKRGTIGLYDGHQWLWKRMPYEMNLDWPALACEHLALLLASAAAVMAAYCGWTIWNSVQLPKVQWRSASVSAPKVREPLPWKRWGYRVVPIAVWLVVLFCWKLFDVYSQPYAPSDGIEATLQALGMMTSAGSILLAIGGSLAVNAWGRKIVASRR